MAIIIIIKYLAKVDLEEIFQYYESKKKGLGVTFMIDFDSIILKIKINPQFASKLVKDARRASLDKFPYYIVYTLENNIVFIHLVIHQSRNPLTTLSRL